MVAFYGQVLANDLDIEVFIIMENVVIQGDRESMPMIKQAIRFDFVLIGGDPTLGIVQLLLQFQDVLVVARPETSLKLLLRFDAVHEAMRLDHLRFHGLEDLLDFIHLLLQEFLGFPFG